MSEKDEKEWSLFDIVPHQTDEEREEAEPSPKIGVMEAIKIFLGPLFVFPELSNELYQMLEAQFELEVMDYDMEPDTSELTDEELAFTPWLFVSDMDLEQRTYEDWRFIILFGLLTYDEEEDTSILMGSVPSLIEEVILPENLEGFRPKLSAKIRLIKKYASHEFFRQTPH